MADDKRDKSTGASPPGVLGDETIEQNLNQPGNPKARITEAEVDAAFGGDKPGEPDRSVQDSGNAGGAQGSGRRRDREQRTDTPARPGGKAAPGRG